MAAYASLLPLTQTIEQILQWQSHDKSPLFVDEVQLQLITSLHEKLSNLLSFLENSSPKNSEATSSLEERIRDVAYEAEDLIESHTARKLVHFQGVTSCFTEIIAVLHYCAMCLVSTTTSQTIKETFEENLQNVIEKLGSISEEVEKMKANNVNGDEGLQSSEFDDASIEIVKDPIASGVPSTVESHATVEGDGVEEAVKVHPRISLLGPSSSKPASSGTSSMVGFENDTRQIKEILTGSSSKLEIISIVGMGGIGKTTLARNIYNDSLVIRRFDIRAWITISQEYSMVALLAGLLRSIGFTSGVDGKDEQELRLKLYQNLKQRRYLIILDDVWDVNLWEKFKRIFPDDDQGSRIIMTSRSSKVASSDKSCTHIHHLGFLSPDQSWNLLCNEAFGEERCPLQLERIARRIAKNCKGLPLTLVLVGGVLNKAQKTPTHWEYVEKNMKFAQTGNYENVMEILSWSYDQLPHHLKACFLYMGVFREDFVVRVSHLIMSWVANGFIRPVASKTLEEVAKEYLEDLIDRNLIIVRERGYCSGKIKTCVLHDLMRNMCVEKARKEKFLLADSLSLTSPVSSKGYRHPRFTSPLMTLSQYGEFYVSLFRPHRRFQHDMWKTMSFQRLKVFNGCEIHFEWFPIEIVQLVNLRFIALFCLEIRKIPVSLSKLRFLQTLLIFTNASHGEYIAIPSEILKMQQLMHLWVQASFFRYCFGGQMENLQTLRGITNLRLTKKTLAIFPNLKTLEVSFSDKKLALGRPCFENMVHLCQLENLTIYGGFRASVFQSLIDLAFPVKLKKLSLSHFDLSQRQLCTIGKLSNLEVLKLKYVTLLDGWKTNEGEFGELKFLFLDIYHEDSWNLEGIHFPSLECLSLQRFNRCLPSEIGEIPNLKVIELYDCLSRVVTSARKIQKDLLEQWGNNTLRVHVYPRHKGERGLRRYMLDGL